MHELTKLDVDSIIERASSLIEQGRRSDARDAIEDFLEHFVFRYFVLKALQLDERGWMRLSLPHCSIVWMTVDFHGNVCYRR